MIDPTVVLVSGLPATGKTTVARRLAGELRLPLISRDEIKERLFDSLGWSDRAWSRRLGAASWALLYWVLEVELAAGRSCIVESNFDPERDDGAFYALRRRLPFEAIQVHCRAEPATLLARFAARVASGERHPGHVDDVTIAEVRATVLASDQRPLPIGGPSLTVDTTDWTRVDWAEILGTVGDWLNADCRPES